MTVLGLCMLKFVEIFRTHKFQVSGTLAEFREDFLGKPRELIKMSVPSLVYALQNNLDFVALSNLEPGVYQVFFACALLDVINFASTLAKLKHLRF